MSAPDPTPPVGEGGTLEERIADVRAARELVYRLASDAARAWRMSIPVQDDDSDMLLLRVLDRAEKDAAEVARLTAELDNAYRCHGSRVEELTDAWAERDAAEARAERYRKALEGLMPVIAWASETSTYAEWLAATAAANNALTSEGADHA